MASARSPATVDQIPGGGTVAGPQLTFEAERVTAREIIRQRVVAEVERWSSSAQANGYLRGLIIQSPEERVLNGLRRERREKLDAERQVDMVLAAVRAGRVIVLFNGEQVSDLDAPLLLTPVSEARFLRLVPLVGG